MHKLPFILTAVLLSLTGLGAAVPPPDKLLPSETFFVVTVPNWAATSKNAGPIFQLWNDAAMKPFKDKFLKKWNSDVVEPFQREFGVKFSDYAGLAQGQVTVAFVEPSGTGDDEKNGLLLMMDTGDKSDAMKTNLANLKKSWVDKGKQIKSEKIRDAEFTTYIFQSDEFSKTLDTIFPDPQEGFEKAEEPKEKKAPRKVELLVGQAGSLLIASESRKGVEKVVARLGGASVPGLSEQANFSTHYGPLFRSADAYGWVNWKAFMDMAMKKSKDGEEKPKRGAFDPQAILKGLGLNAVQSLAFSFQNAPEGVSARFVVNIPESQRQGLFKIVAFPQKEAAPPPFVPADATKFSRWRLDMPQAWATLEKTLSEVQPQLAGMVKLIMDSAGKDKDPNFDLRKNLIENLGDDIVNYSKSPKNATLADLNSPPSITLIGSPRPEPLAAALKALAAPLLPPQAKMKEREFLGRKVYTVNLPAQPGPRGAGAGATKVDRSVSFAATGAYVAISTDTPMLEEFLRGNQEKQLREFSGLASAADKVGGMGTGLFGFENQKETTRSTLEILRKESGTLANLLGSTPLAGRLGVGDDQSKFKEWLDFSLLPPFDKISKYFHIGVWSGAVKADGFHFHVFNPTPPGLK